MNPIVWQWDADGDALPDVYELANFGSTLDPCVSEDGAEDMDMDLISNADEYWNLSHMNDSDPTGHGLTGENKSFWADSGEGDGLIGPDDFTTSALLQMSK